MTMKEVNAINDFIDKWGDDIRIHKLLRHAAADKIDLRISNAGLFHRQLKLTSKLSSIDMEYMLITLPETVE